MSAAGVPVLAVTVCGHGRVSQSESRYGQCRKKRRVRREAVETYETMLLPGVTKQIGLVPAMPGGICFVSEWPAPRRMTEKISGAA